MRFGLPLIACMLLALAACGGSGANTPALPAVEAPQRLIAPLVSAGLPALPDPGSFSLHRMTSSVFQDAMLDGSNTESGLAAQPSALNPRELDLASAANSVAYALYRFNGAPGEEVDSYGVSLSQLSAGGRIFTALSNYSTGRWQFFAPEASTVLNVALPSVSPAYCSQASGALYLLVAVYGGDTATVRSVRVSFPNRHGVSGQALDDLGAPLPGVQISAGILGQTATTDSTGSFTLGGLPDGTWTLTATSSGFTFYANPQAAVLAGADVGGVKFTGHRNSSNFLPADRNGYNNDFNAPSPINLGAGAVTESLSSVDDPRDCQLLSFAAAGKYLIQFSNSSQDIFYPVLELRDLAGNLLRTSAGPLSGAVSLQIPAPVPGYQCILVVTCGGGGGEYVLTRFAEPVSRLAGKVSLGPNALPGAQIAAVEPDTGLATTYVMPPVVFPGANFSDDARRTVRLNLTPSSPNYTYAPASFMARLELGNELNANFSSTLLPLGDHFEPNNGSAQAQVNAVLTLPYDSDGQHELSMGAGDGTDWYMFTPPSGLGLRAEVDFGPGEVQPGTVVLYDDDPANTIAQANFVGGRAGVELPFTTDGARYWLRIDTTDIQYRHIRYKLKIYTYTPVRFVATASFDGLPLDNVRVDLRQNGFGMRRAMVTGLNGKSPAVLVKEGDQLYLEAFRPGLDIHRQTRIVVAGAADFEENFAASGSGSSDSFEPNPNPATAPLIGTLPVAVRATLDPETDQSDAYRMTMQSANPVEVGLAGLAAGVKLSLQFSDGMGNSLSSFDLASGEYRLFDPGAAGELRLVVLGDPGGAIYRINLRQTTAFSISGLVMDGANPVAGAKLHCNQTGETVESDAGGAYSFALAAPGIYEIACWAAGYTVAGTPASVTVAGGDATQDFALSVNPAADHYEPNDTALTPALLAANSQWSEACTLGAGADTGDFYAFPLTKNALVTVRLEWDQPWYNDAGIASVSSPTFGVMGTCYNFGLGYQEVVFTALESAQHSLAIQNFGLPVEYRVRITTAN